MSLAAEPRPPARGSRKPDSIDDAFAAAAAEVNAALRERDVRGELLQRAREAHDAGDRMLMVAWLTALHYAGRAPNHRAGGQATAAPYQATKAWCLREFDRLREASPGMKVEALYRDVVDNLLAEIGRSTRAEQAQRGLVAVAARTVRRYVAGKNR